MMKIFNRIFLIAPVLLLLLSGCTKNLTTLNVDPKNPTTIAYNALFTEGQYYLSFLLNNADYDYNPQNFFEQYWQETTYLNESQYDILYRGIPDLDWNVLYLNVLANLYRADSLAKTQVTDAGTLANVHAQIDITEVQAFYYLVTTYGNVPYTDAFKITSTSFPKYDDAMTVYKDLLSRLAADIAALNNASSTTDGIGAADQIYGGDISAWIKYANSLELRMGILIADVDDATAKATVEAAAPNVFASNADNAYFTYTTSPPYVNPIYNFMILGARIGDFVGCTTFINQLQSNNDPRLPLFFTTNADTSSNYTGVTPGDGGSYFGHARPTPTIETADFRGDFLDYPEVQFYLAEAAERGYNVGGTAATFYQNGVEGSILQWGGAQADADAYYAQTSVNYATAAGTWQQKIGTQAWIAFYNRAWDAWTETRRLSYPVLPVPDKAVSTFPYRFTYPVAETNVNSVNVEAAAQAIGGDVRTTKLFFIKQ
jgi:hypothetical protein